MSLCNKRYFCRSVPVPCANYILPLEIIRNTFDLLPLPEIVFLAADFRDDLGHQLLSPHACLIF